MIDTTNEHAINYDLKYISSYRQLAKELNLDARASFSGWGASVSASYNLFKSTNFTSEKAYILIKMRVVSSVSSLNQYKIKNQFLNSVSNSFNKDNFETKYGDAFISHVVKGGEFYALMEFSSSSTKTIEDVRKSLSAGYGGFSASAEQSTSLEKILKSSNVKVNYAQTGGLSGRVTRTDDVPETGSILTLTPKELFGRIREFPQEVFKSPENSVILEAETLDYNVVENIPANLAPKSKLPILWAFEDLAETKLVVEDRKNFYETFIDEPIGYSKDDQEAANNILVYIEYLIKEIDRIAEGLITYPSESSVEQLTNLKLPAEITFTASRADCNQTNISTGNCETGALIAKQNGIECPSLTQVPLFTEICLFGDNAFRPVRTPEPEGIIDRKKFRAGSVPVGLNHGANFKRSGRINFDPAFDTKDIVVVLTPETTTIDDDHNDTYAFTVRELTKDGFRIHGTRTDGEHQGWGGSVPIVHWMAYEKD